MLEQEYELPPLVGEIALRSKNIKILVERKN